MNPAKLLVITLLISICSYFAAAQERPTALAPNPTVGDVLTYRTVDRFSDREIGRFSMTFEKRDGSVLIYRARNLQNDKVRLQNLTGNLEFCERSKEGDTEVCAGPYRFPLLIGEKSSFDRQPRVGNDGFDSSKCEVVALEKVTVPAGQFDAFRVECAGIWRSSAVNGGWSSAVNFNDTYWYAPLLNAQVKFVTIVHNATASHSGSVVRDELRELTDFKPGTVVNSTPSTTFVNLNDANVK